jgi:rhodanese-related sulfurtransferase
MSNMDTAGQIVPLSPRDAFEYLQENAAILDIRPEYETDYRVFDVPKVFYLSYGSYRDNFHIIPMDIPLIVADSAGNRSAEVAQYLLAQGYSQIAYLAGGMIEWNRDGLPLLKDIDYELIGGCACRLHPQSARAEGSKVAPKRDC